jgi:tetratricopeptide (TPR) repeat protein
MVNAMKCLLSFFFYCVFSASGKGQLHSIDSLKSLLAEAKEDTNSIRLLQDISSFYDESDSDSSILFENRALELARKLNFKKGETHSIIHLGFLAMTQGNYPTALELLFQARKDNANGPEDLSTADIYQNIGLVYYYMRDFEASKQWLEKAKGVADDLNLVDNYFIRLNLGRAYLKSNNLDSALLYTSDAYNINTRTKSLFGRSTILLTLGEIHEKLGHENLSLEFYRQAIAAARNENGRRALIRAYLSLSNFYSKQNRPDSAMAFAMKALSESRQARYTQQLMESATFVSKLYNKRNQNDSAYFYQSISSTSRDAMYGQEKQSRMSNLVFSDILRDLEQQRIEDKEKRYRKTNLQFVVIAVALSIFSVAFLLLSRSIIVDEKLIKFFGVIGLLMVFEFINLLIHPFLVEVTRNSAFFLLLALVIVAAILIPLHHKIQDYVTKIIVRKNKQIRLASARKTIQELEREVENSE